jgi:hypothetical protein
MLHLSRSISRLCLVAASVLAAASVSLAQGPAATGTIAPLTAAERSVRDAVLARFRALPVQNGIVLVPLSRIDGVDNVELREGTVAVNGRVVTGGEVRQLLGRDAGPVLELSYLGIDQQRRLLLVGEAGRAEPPPAAAEPQRPEPPAEPASPATAFPERRFRQQVETRVRVGGNISVAADEEVNGPVVAVFGSVTVNGRVRDNVVAVGGDVRLGPTADVRGDVVAVGGSVDRDSSANVSGQISEVSFPPVAIHPKWDFGWNWVPWFDAGPWRVVRLLGSLLRMALFTLLATLILLLAPRAVQRVEWAVTSQPWKSVIVGLLAQLFFVPVLVIVVVVLAVSIIGIPLLVLVPFGVLAFFVALLLGFTGAAMGIARLVQRRFDWSQPGSFPMLIVGLVAVWGTTVLGRLVAFGGGPVSVMAALLLFTGFVVEYAVWTVGLGGALLTRFGRFGTLPVSVPTVPPSAPSTTAADPLADDISRM